MVCVVYDMLMLASALSVRQTNEWSPPRFPGLRWGKEKIAEEVLLLKSRCLLEFLTGGTRPSDIRITDLVTDFELSIDPPPDMTAFRRVADKRSVHLTWTRTEDRTLDETELDLDRFALWVLARSYDAVQTALSSGLGLDRRHLNQLAAFEGIYRSLIAGFTVER